MSTNMPVNNNDKIRRKKTIRIEPSPFVSPRIKIQMKQTKVDATGRPMKVMNTLGQYVDKQEMVDVNNIVQYPGTIKYVKAAVTSRGKKTGLTYLVNNPYKENSTYYPAWGEKILKGHDKALLQHILEYKHGKDLGFYTNQISRSHYLEGTVAPFFARPESKLPLTGNVIFLNLEDPNDEIMYYVCKDSKIIANSYDDLKEGVNKDALYYIVDTNEQLSRKEVRVQQLNEAAFFLETLKRKNDSSLMHMAKALDIRDLPITTDDKAYLAIVDFYKKDNKNMDSFISYYHMNEDQARREYFVAASMLYDYVKEGIITLSKGKFYWTRPKIGDIPSENFIYNGKNDIITNLLLSIEYMDDANLIQSIYQDKVRFN